ncbi:MAG: DNA helicase UvrD [Methylotenera sp.]|nr:MAG: DNA helicase UvrD [Methylotenera sp.]
MDKRVVFAVAGSGKTTSIISRLDLEKRYLIVTYTDNNYANLRRKIINKFNFFPPNIALYTYFTFLHSFCYKPFLLNEIKSKGINFKHPPNWPRSSSNISYYVDGQKRLYHNRIAKLLDFVGVIPDVTHRLEKYFDTLFVDEVQDFAGHDFNFLTSICSSNINLFFVGDFYQHTYATSQDGATNLNLHKDYDKYKKRFSDVGLAVDTTSLAKSYRCSESVCTFIRNNTGIGIYSHSENITEVKFIEDDVVTKDLLACNSTVKLFYQEHQKYNCYSNNWGNSKGLDDYQNVCVALNGSMLKAYTIGSIHKENAQTINKFYVACSRARGNLYLIDQKRFKSIS